MLKLFSADWVFLIPSVYENCNKTEAECQSQGAKILHRFDNFNPGTKNMTAVCIGTKPGQGLPYW